MIKEIDNSNNPTRNDLEHNCNDQKKLILAKISHKIMQFITTMAKQNHLTIIPDIILMVKKTWQWLK